MTGTAYPLEPGNPLELHYRVVIRSGKGLSISPARLFTAYVSDLPDPRMDLATYGAGQDRRPLALMEQALQKVSKEEHRAFEGRLLKMLAGGNTSGDFRRWACKMN